MTPEEAADRVGIRELIDACAHCADRRDADSQMALFAPDTHNGRGGTVSVGPASRPRRNRNRKRSGRVGSEAERPPRTATGVGRPPNRPEPRGLEPQSTNKSGSAR
jgi:hypothetical protein